MEPIESSETSAYINTLTPGTYPKEKKLQSKHGESLKSRKRVNTDSATNIGHNEDVGDNYCNVIMNIS